MASTRTPCRLNRLAPALLLWVLVAGGLLQAQDDTVAVIAHAEVPAESISGREAFDFYSGDIRSWSNGMPVVVMDLKPRGPVKDTFYDFLGKSAARMKSIWLKKMLSGEGDPPKTVDDEPKLVEMVARTPGAIGFTHRRYVTDSVKVLAVLPIRSPE